MQPSRGLACGVACRLRARETLNPGLRPRDSVRPPANVRGSTSNRSRDGEGADLAVAELTPDLDPEGTP